MGADLRAVQVPPASQEVAGRRVPGHLIAHQQGQGEAELAGDKFQPAKLGDVGNAGDAGILAGKEPFFLHVETDDELHGSSQ
jgi:hypothetical protein